MSYIENVIKKAKEKQRTIILPETDDTRILKAAEYIATNDIANIIFIDRKENILEKAEVLSLNLSKNIECIDHFTDEKRKEYIEKLYELRKHKNISIEDADKLLEDKMYYANMLLLDERADAIVAGAVYSTKNVLKPALQIIKTKEDSKLVSSFFVIDTKNEKYGENGVYIFADCGLNIDPNAEELSNIAIDSAKTFRKLVSNNPKVAMLSFSSFGSASSDSTEKIQKTLNIIKEKNIDFEIDGEMQLDTAIIPDVAKRKAPNSKVAGNANILIFPNLDSGNIGYKMAQYMSGGYAYGPFLQGIKKVVNDLSRGASVEEIIGVIAISAIMVED